MVCSDHGSSVQVVRRKAPVRKRQPSEFRAGGSLRYVQLRETDFQASHRDLGLQEQKSFMAASEGTGGLRSDKWVLDWPENETVQRGEVERSTQSPDPNHNRTPKKNLKNTVMILQYMLVVCFPVRDSVLQKMLCSIKIVTLIFPQMIIFFRFSFPSKGVKVRGCC